MQNLPEEYLSVLLGLSYTWEENTCWEWHICQSFKKKRYRLQWSSFVCPEYGGIRNSWQWLLVYFVTLHPQAAVDDGAACSDFSIAVQWPSTRIDNANIMPGSWTSGSSAQSDESGGWASTVSFVQFIYCWDWGNCPFSQNIKMVHNLGWFVRVYIGKCLRPCTFIWIITKSAIQEEQNWGFHCVLMDKNSGQTNRM